MPECWPLPVGNTARAVAGAQPLFGFMSLNGNSCVSAVRQAKTEDLMEFMQCIRCVNNDDKPIGIVLDNAAIHKAKAVLEHCCQLDIHLIRLPTYSPELNPIEYLWKDGKKQLSKTRDFDGSQIQGTRCSWNSWFNENTHTPRLGNVNS